jgi:hypothetical protein
LSILEAGYGLLDQQGRLLVDVSTSYCSLGETRGDRCLKSRHRSLREANQICGKRSVSSREISCGCLDDPGVGIWSDQGLRVRPELAYRLGGKRGVQAGCPSLTSGNGKQGLNT